MDDKKWILTIDERAAHVKAMNQGPIGGLYYAYSPLNHVQPVEPTVHDHPCHPHTHLPWDELQSFLNGPPNPVSVRRDATAPTAQEALPL